MILIDLDESEDNRFNGRRVLLELNIILNVIVSHKHPGFAVLGIP